MYSDKVLEPGQEPGAPAEAGAVDVVSVDAAGGPKPDSPVEGDPAKCKRACDAYDMAHANYLELYGSATAAKSDRNAAAGVAVAGLAILAMAATSLVWGLAVAVAVACGALAVRQQLVLNDVRDRCQAAIQTMYIEYRAAKKSCGNAENVPSRPSETSP